MKQFLQTACCAALVLFTSTRCFAQDDSFKPVFVVAINDYETFVGNLKFIGSLVNDDAFVDKVELLVGQLTGAEGVKIEGLEGVEMTKPWGFAIVSNGLDIVPFSFAPVTDVEAFLTSMEPWVGDAPQNDEGLYEVDLSKVLSLVPANPLVGAGQVTGLLKERNGWALTAQLAEHLDMVPEPDAMLGDLMENHQLVIQLNVANLPEGLRSMLDDQSSTLEIPGLSMAPEQLPDESDAQFAVRSAAMNMLQQYGTMLLRDSEEITVGFSLDQEKKLVVGDFYCRPVPDSDLAKHIDAMKGAKSRFAAMMADPENALLAMRTSAALDQARMEPLKKFIDAYHVAVNDLIDNSEDVQTDEERQTFHELTDVLSEVLHATVDGGQVDAGVRIIDQRLPSTIVGGVTTPDVEKLKTLFERVAELAKKDKGFASVKLNMGQAGDVPIHSLKLVPNESTAMLSEIADDLTMYVAFGPDAAWWSMGTAGLDEIKKAIGAEEQPVPPLQVSMRVSPLLNLATADPQMALIVTLLGSQLRGEDRITAVLETTDDGLRGHLEIQEGFMRVVGVLTPIVGGMIGGGGAPAGGGLPLPIRSQ